MLVTTVYDPSPGEHEQAQEIAAFLQVPYVCRCRSSLNSLKQRYQVSTLVVVLDTGPIVYQGKSKLFFHPGMAALRIKNIHDGKPDHMLTAMNLLPNMSVLDCTLGLASDALVAGVISGVNGQIIGLETSPVIAFITGWGLSHCEIPEHPELVSAARRIRVVATDYRNYLLTLPDNSIDVVYFDPMFRQPVEASAGMKPLRAFASMQALTKADLDQAYRVAKQRVVIKETNGSLEFQRLGITELVGGKYSSIRYGVIVKVGS